LIKDLALALALLSPTLLVGDASAGPVRFKSPVTCTTEAGSSIKLPPGFYLSAELWAKLDLETRRLQALEVRLGAENKSLKKSLEMRSGTTALVSGLILGIAVGHLAF
jgi:hypothetical protein